MPLKKVLVSLSLGFLTALIVVMMFPRLVSPISFGICPDSTQLNYQTNSHSSPGRYSQQTFYFCGETPPTKHADRLGYSSIMIRTTAVFSGAYFLFFFILQMVFGKSFRTARQIVDAAEAQNVDLSQAKDMKSFLAMSQEVANNMGKNQESSRLSNSTTEQRLKELEQLYQKKLIDYKEYETKRQEILSQL